MLAIIVPEAMEARKAVPPDDGVQAWPVAELPKALASADNPLSVRVAFPIRLSPTADPLVWTYSGSSPDVLPKVYEVHFAEVPTFTAPPIVIEGRAEFVADTLRRPNGVRGFVRLTGAEIRP